MSTEAKAEIPNGTSETTSQSRLAALVGFEEEAADQQLLETTPKLETTDAEEDTILSPKDTPTVPPHWSRGTNKAYLVLAVSAVMALIGYMAMARIFSSPIKKASQPAQNLQDFPIPASEKEDQTAKIKASLALGKQVEAVKKLNQEYLQKNQPVKQASAAKSENPSPKPKRQEVSPSPRRSSPVPQIIPRPVTQIPPPRVVTPPAKQPTVTATPEPAPDPLTTWHQLAQVGSYGQITKAKEPNNSLVKSSSDVYQQDRTVQANDSFNPSPSTTRVADANRVSSLQLPLEAASTNRVEPTTRQSMKATSPKSELQQMEREEAAILSEQPLQTKVLQATTTVSSRLVTPLFWSDDLRATDTPQVALQLEQPLVAADGTNIFPSGTRLLAQVNNVSASGLVEATVTSVIDPQGKSDREITPGIIVLQGDQGQPLIAKAKQQKQSRSRVNLGQVLEDVLNENYEDLPRNLEQRNNQNRIGSGTLWYLTADEPIELFVKQTFEFNL